MANNTVKMTYAKALTAVLNDEPMTAEMREKLSQLLAQLEKKSVSDGKPTSQQVKNDGYRATIIDILSDGTPRTVAELSAELNRRYPDDVTGFSSQRTNQLVMPMWQKLNTLRRYEDKRKAYFTLPDAE